MPVREARDRSPKSPRWSAGRRASRVMGRKAPRKAPGLPRHVQAHGCLASTRTSLGAPPPLDRGDAERKFQNPGAENAPRERERLFHLVNEEPQKIDPKRLNRPETSAARLFPMRAR